MSFDPQLPPNTILNNEMLCKIFGCGIQGGMRRSHKTNSLVIITDHVKSVYYDRWLGNIFHYTGMGLEGDQSLTSNQNKTLAESATNGIAVFLFEIFEDQKYTYIGQVGLAEQPYQETQNDINGAARKVWMFPVKLLSGEVAPVQESVLYALEEKKAKLARKLSDKELFKRALTAPKQAGSRQGISNQHIRNVWVSEMAQRRAKGCCQLCSESAPFKRKDGSDYLETHHVVWLAKGGTDTLDNTVALCPNCHRKMHILSLETDIKKLAQIAKQDISGVGGI